MKKSSKALIIIAIILVCILGCYSCFKGTYNNFVTQEEAVESAWSDVQNQYQRRLDLIPNLVATVKGAATHEQETFESVTKARAAANSQITVTSDVLDNPEAFAKFQKAQDELSSSLQRLMAVAEAYPELKANQNFLSLQDQLEGTENRITVARTRYNEAAKSYNTSIRKFPANIIANMSGFDKKQYFAASSEAQTAPTVSFE